MGTLSGTPNCPLRYVPSLDQSHATDSRDNGRISSESGQRVKGHTVAT